MNKTGADASDALAHELIRLRRGTEAIRTKLARDAGVTLENAAMSVLITTVKGGPQRSTELARRLGLDTSTMSRHVSTLVSDGLVHRIADPVDGRAMLVEATPAGHDLFVRVSEQRAILMRRLLSSWSEAEVSLLAQLLCRFNDTADGAGDLGPHLAPDLHRQHPRQEIS